MLADKKMEPEEAARVCGAVVEDMGKALATSKGFIKCGGEYFDLISGFAVVASRQTPAAASRSARLSGRALKRDGQWVLAGALEQESDVRVLTKGLATAAAGMEPVEAERICGEAARVLADTLRRQPGDPYAPAGELAVLAGRMKRVEAERICGEAARVLADAVRQQPDNPNGISQHAAILAARMEPVQAVRMLAELFEWEIAAEARMTHAEEMIGWYHSNFAKRLSAAAVGVEPGEATWACEEHDPKFLRSRD